MKIRFFGDSWLWSWYYKATSSTIKSKLRSEEGLPIFEIYLNYLGIDIEHHNTPGNDFDRTVETILTTTNHEGIKYNIVFFSSLLRRNSRLLETTKNYKQLLSTWNSYVVEHLTNINQWAEQNNQEVFHLLRYNQLYLD